MGPEKENPQYADILAEDAKLGADDAAVLPARLDRYSKAHRRALAMSDYATELAANSVSKFSQDEVRKLAQRLQSCGEYLLFRDYYTVGKVRLHAARFCKKHLLCPLCAIRRGAKMVKAYLDRLEVIKAERPNLKAYLVTLTVKNGPDLLERYTHLQRSVHKLHKTRTGKGQYSEACKADGAVWSFEFKRGANSKEWHPHMHAVWLAEEEPDKFELSKQWKAITGDSFIVDVTPFHDQEDVVSGFLEVFKYAVKFSDLPMEDNWHGYQVLAGKRLIASFGAFRAVEIPESLTDEPLDELPYIEHLYRYFAEAGYSRVNDHKPAEAPPSPLPPVRNPPAPAPSIGTERKAHLRLLQKKYPKKEEMMKPAQIPERSPEQLQKSRAKDREQLGELLHERDECVAAGVNPYGSNAAAGYCILLMGGLASEW